MPFNLKLLHGRRSPDKDMDDWGADGPLIEGIMYFHVTYNSIGSVGFESKEACDIAQRQLGWQRDGPKLLWGGNLADPPSDYKRQSDLVATYAYDELWYWGDWEFQDPDSFEMDFD